MKRCVWTIVFLVANCAGVLRGQVIDEGESYRVAASEVVSVGDGETPLKDKGEIPLVVRRNQTPDSRRSVLLRFDLKDIPLRNSVNTRLLLNGKASGEGGNPSFSIYAVDGNWNASNSPMPKKIQKIGDLTIKTNYSGPLTFPVTKYIGTALNDHGATFLIEMRSAPGFSQSVEFSRNAELLISKDETPDFHIQDLLKPIWKTARITNETVLPTAYGDTAAVGNLAFEPVEILSVKNYALTKQYKEAQDYSIQGRTIRLAGGSSIPSFHYDELYHNNPKAKPATMKTLDGGYLTFSESAFFNDRQLAVSYEHADKWDGLVPSSAENRLPGTFEKLCAGKPVRLIVFGDSISVGASASGQCARPPFMPPWTEMVVDQLALKYHSPIDYINPSLGGTASGWGRDTVDGLVSFEDPDLVILGFGMNDGAAKVTPDQFRTNVQAIIASVRHRKPDAEFILLMSFQPNGKWRHLDLMEGYLDALHEMEGMGIAVADVWSIHGYLLKHKTYWDMTGNHVNHPNDFIVRVYAQTILALLGVN